MESALENVQQLIKNNACKNCQWSLVASLHGRDCRLPYPQHVSPSGHRRPVSPSHYRQTALGGDAGCRITPLSTKPKTSPLK